MFHRGCFAAQCIALIVGFPLVHTQLSIPLSRQSAQLPSQNLKPPKSIELLGIPELLTNYQNVYYYGDIKLGTPGDTLRVVFDTGSPSLWVYSGSGLESWLCLSCWFHRTYHHSRSSTYTPLGAPVLINYVSGYMKGYSSQDVLTIGNLSVPVMFGEATSTPFSTSLSEKFDGVLGLGPCSGLQCPLYRELTDPVIHSILAHLPKPVFSIYLDRSGENNGEITFGGTNPELHDEASLRMYPTTRSYAWTLALDSIWVGEVMVANYSYSFVEAYIDSGTSLLVGPPSDVDSILRQMGIPFGLQMTKMRSVQICISMVANYSYSFVEAYIDSGTSLLFGPPSDVDSILRQMGIPFGLQVPCDEIKNLPPLSFVIGGDKYTLYPEEYASTRTKPLFGPEICYHGLQGVFLSSNSWILGDVFIGKFYSVFEVKAGKSSRIGFANLKAKQ